MALNVESALSNAPARVTEIVYVLVETGEADVETTVTVVGVPAESTCEAELLPDDTALPPTVIVPPPWLAVGVTVIPDTAFATDAVYENVSGANAGDRVPVLSIKPSRTAEARLITRTEYVVAPPAPVD